MHHSIEIEGLSYSYPDGHQALIDVTLTIKPGEKVALVGPNGAGKSTLILHLNGILKGEGTVKSAGLLVNEKNLARIRARVGAVGVDGDVVRHGDVCQQRHVDRGGLVGGQVVEFGGAADLGSARPVEGNRVARVGEGPGGGPLYGS